MVPHWGSRVRSGSFVAVMFGIAAIGCAQSVPREVSPVADSALAAEMPVASPVLTGDQSADRARLDSLVVIARSLARAEGCGAAAECRTAALGVKACGGPKEYLVYCSASTDSVALASAVDLVNTMEREFNERYNLVSDCMLLLEPGTSLEGGACVASRDGPGGSR